MVNNKDASFTFTPIGYIKSCYPDKFGVPRQSGLVNSTVSELEILPQWQPELALQGLDGYSHVWLQFVFHLNKNTKYHPKVHPPRLQGQTMGVFATRSPHRPNPIGLSLCEIAEIKLNKIYLYGVDLVDGTPILDVKPYLPQFENQPQAKGGWATNSENEVSPIQVYFTSDFQNHFEQWKENIQIKNLDSIIKDIIKQDPRPVVYRGFESQTSPYRSEHVFKLYNADIHFRFTDALTAEVFLLKIIE